MRAFVIYSIVCLLLWLSQNNGLAGAGRPQKTPVQLPEETLSAAEVVRLFSDKTVESITAVRGRVSLSYYDPNGEVHQRRNNKERYGSWRVKKNGRICLQMEQLPEKCRIIVKHGNEHKKYIVRKNGKHQHSVSYRKFLPGNPFGL